MTPDLLHKSARRLPNARNITKKRLVIVCGNSGIGFVTAEKEGAGTLRCAHEKHFEHSRAHVFRLRICHNFPALSSILNTQQSKRNQYTTDTHHGRN